MQLSKYIDDHSVHLILKLCWKNLNKKFEKKITMFRNHVKKIEKEAEIFGMIETHQEWALMKYEKKRKSLWKAEVK